MDLEARCVEVGKLLRQVRRYSCRWSQAGLGRRIGVTRQTIGHYERGRYPIPARQAGKLLEIFPVHIAALIFFEQGGAMEPKRLAKLERALYDTFKGNKSFFKLSRANELHLAAQEIARELLKWYEDHKEESV